MKKGFTLIEMAVVLLIIGILAGIVLRNIGGQSVQARDAKRVGDLRNLANYLAQYMAKQGQFPKDFDKSSNGWNNLKDAFQSAGMSVNLPNPPSGASTDVYEYFPCTDAPGITEANHFILRTRLEQSKTQAPRAYEGTYDSANVPSGWQCTGWTGTCDSSQRYYCVTQ